MRYLRIIFLLPFFIGGSALAGDSEPLLKDREQKSLAPLFAAYFKARMADDYKGMSKTYSALEKKLASTAKSKKVDTILLSPSDLRATYGSPPLPEKRVKKGYFVEVSTEVPLAGGKVQVLTYLISIPKNYRHDNRSPAILALHPAMERADQLKTWTRKAYPSAIADNAIIVIPVNTEGMDWSSLEGRMLAFFSIRDASTRYNIDRLQFVLEGHADAADDALKYAIGYPSMFSSVILRGPDSMPSTDRLENVRSLGVLFMPKAGGDESVGEQFASEAKEFGVDVQQQIVEISEDGAVGEAGAAAIQEVVSRVKVIAPKRVRFSTDSNEHINSYWLEITKMEVSDDVAVTVEGEVISDQNEIHVKTPPSVHGFRVHLNDSLVDMGKPIKIVHTVSNDEAQESVVRFEGTKPRSFEKSLNGWFLNLSGNFGEVYTNYIEIEVPQ